MGALVLSASARPSAAALPLRRVLLVSPPYHCGMVESAGVWMPLGLAYLAGSLRAAKVFPQPAWPGFPRHALLTGSHPVAYVRYRQLDRQEAYTICRFPRGEAIPVSRRALPGVSPKRPLAAGRYLVVAAQEGMWGGRDCYCFQVEAEPRRANGRKPLSQ